MKNPMNHMMLMIKDKGRVFGAARVLTHPQKPKKFAESASVGTNPTAICTTRTFSASASSTSSVTRSSSSSNHQTARSSSHQEIQSGSGSGSVALRLSNINDIDKVEDIMSLYDEMVMMRPLPYAIHFSKLLGRLVKMKKYSSSPSLYRNMCIPGIPVHESTLNIVINCFCLVGRVDYGLSVMGTFFKRGYVPDVCTFATMLKGLSSQGRISEALELFKKIIYEKLCPLNPVLYGTLINALCKEGNTEAAIELLRVMERGNSWPVQR